MLSLAKFDVRNALGLQVVTPDVPHRRSQDPGIYLGAVQDERGRTRWLRDETDQHVLLMGPTRCGKSVTLVSTLLSYPGSMVIHDLKGEMWALTAAYRKKVLGHRVFRFDPTCNDGTGAHFNPLDQVRLRTDREVADSENISTLICDPDGRGMTGEHRHWTVTARSFLSGVILHILYYERDKTLRGVDAFLSDPNREQVEVFQRMLTAEHDPEYTRGWIDAGSGKPTMTCPTVAKSARDMLMRPDGECGSILSTAKAFLDIYRDDILAKNTSESDLSIQDLMNNEKPCDLYIVNYPSDMDRTVPLTRLLFNFVLRSFTGVLRFTDDGRPIKDYKHPLLLVMDEFPALGRLDIFASALSYLAGFGIRVIIVLQDYSQLEERYQKPMSRSLMANMHIKIIHAPGDPDTASVLSGMLGTMTLRIENRTTNTRGGGSTSTGFEPRHVISAEELMKMHKDDTIVHVMHESPAYTQRIQYFREPIFKRRVLPQLHRSDHIPLEEQAAYRLNAQERELAAAEAVRRRAAAEESRQREQRAQSSGSQPVAQPGVAPAPADDSANSAATVSRSDAASVEDFITPSSSATPGFDSSSLIPTKEDLTARLSSRIVGQRAALELVAGYIRGKLASREGTSNKPLAFLLAGPTGTGKTEFAKAVSEVLEAFPARFDMGEYSDQHKASNLFGSAKGYSGHSEGGFLPNVIRRSQGLSVGASGKLPKGPVSAKSGQRLVVLFDEVEKAAPSIWQDLLAFLDEGRCADAIGQTIAPKDTIVFLTTNRCAEEIGNDPSQAKEILRQDGYFSSEFLGRVEKVVPMLRLSENEGIELTQWLLLQLGNDYGITLNVDAAALRALYAGTHLNLDRSGGRGINETLKDLLTDDLVQLQGDGETEGDVVLQAGEVRICAHEGSGLPAGGAQQSLQLRPSGHERENNLDGLNDFLG